MIDYIVPEGAFKRYGSDSVASRRLQEARNWIYSSGNFSSKYPTVFISHSHNDLDDLRGLIKYLEDCYGVKCYIDSDDKAMPSITSPITAQNIKERIILCNKFILLATEKAIDSKWCNWELGFGDGAKNRGDTAVFRFSPEFWGI